MTFNKGDSVEVTEEDKTENYTNPFDGRTGTIAEVREPDDGKTHEQCNESHYFVDLIAIPDKAPESKNVMFHESDLKAAQG